MNKLNGTSLFLAVAAGNAALIFGLYELIMTESGRTGLPNFICLTLIFLALARLYIKLPSGANWRPAMAVMPIAIFLFPPAVTGVAAIPGLILICSGNGRWKGCVVSFAHVASPLTAGAFVYGWCMQHVHIGSFYSNWVVSGVCGLAVVFIINRLLSALILSTKSNRSILWQIKVMAKEIHWGYFTAYLLSLGFGIQAAEYGPIALLIAIAAHLGAYQSLKYYIEMHTWQNAALKDKLTQLENRGAWERFIENFQQKPQTGTLAVIDLDYFKNVNDTKGHMFGDQILQEVAAKLRQELPGAARAFRYGGDEFVVYYPHAEYHESAVRNKLFHIVGSLSDSWQAAGLDVRASIGFAVFPRESSDIRELFFLADQKMYITKSVQKADKFE